MADQKRSPTRELSPQTALSDNPQEDWGESADEGATYSANHALRGAKSDAERSQGAKTRKATKDAISRRG
jgi:hypothetical protein